VKGEKIGIKYFLGDEILPAIYEQILPLSESKNAYLVQLKNKFKLIFQDLNTETPWFEIYDKPYAIFNYDNGYGYLRDSFFAKLGKKTVLITPEGKVWDIENPKSMPYKVKKYITDDAL
jgi:hypothetical protein